MVVILVLLLISVIAWIVVSIYGNRTNVEIDPIAELHVQNPVPSSFNLEVVAEVTDRIDNLPVSTKTFKIIEQQVQFEEDN